MSHPAAGMARMEPIAAIINDLPKTAGERWRRAWKGGILEAQVAMISPWIRKIKDTLTRTCWRLRCCISRIPSTPGADLLSCAVNLIGDRGHNSGQGCRTGFRLLKQSFRPCQTVQSSFLSKLPPRHFRRD